MQRAISQAEPVEKELTLQVDECAQASSDQIEQLLDVRRLEIKADALANKSPAQRLAPQKEEDARGQQILNDKELRVLQ